MLGRIRHIPNGIRFFASLSEEGQCLYTILEVSPDASADELKRAFRKRAKESHPDVAKCNANSRRHHFGAVLNAYKVLSNPQQRELYDVTRNDIANNTWSSAAAAGVHVHSEAAARDWVAGAGWFAHVVQPQRQGAEAGAMEHLRTDLHQNLNAALRAAYLGPRVDMTGGHLPECFEMEERTSPGVGDVLQLVSGRQLLGFVRERSDGQLAGDAVQQSLQTRQGEWQPISDGFPDLPSPTQQPSCLQATQHQAQAAAEARLDSSSMADERDPHSHQHPEQLGGEAQPQVLELVVNGALTALGIRHTPDGLAQVLGQSMPLCDRTASASATQPDNANPEGLITCVLTPGGDPLAWERAGQVHKGGLHSPQSHAVWGGQTALVRHLYVTTQVGQQEITVCRCKRAWLPPCSTWLFEPRSPMHTTGGWYMEWCGHRWQSHPQWLHPAVFILLAAFDTLKHEALDSERQQNAQQQSGSSLKQVLKNMLRFHHTGGS